MICFSPRLKAAACWWTQEKRQRTRWAPSWTALAEFSPSCHWPLTSCSHMWGGAESCWPDSTLAEDFYSLMGFPPWTLEECEGKRWMTRFSMRRLAGRGFWQENIKESQRGTRGKRCPPNVVLGVTLKCPSANPLKLLQGQNWKFQQDTDLLATAPQCGEINQNSCHTIRSIYCHPCTKQTCLPPLTSEGLHGGRREGGGRSDRQVSALPDSAGPETWKHTYWW